MTLNTQREKEPLRRRASTPLPSAHIHPPWARDPRYPASQSESSQSESIHSSQSQPSQSESTQSSQSESIQSSQSESIQSSHSQPSQSSQSESTQSSQSESTQSSQAESTQSSQSESIQPSHSQPSQSSQSESSQSESTQSSHSQPSQSSQSESSQSESTQSSHSQPSQSSQSESTQSSQSESTQSSHSQPSQSESTQSPQSESIQSSHSQPSQSESTQSSQSESIQSSHSQPSQSESTQSSQSESIQSSHSQPSQSSQPQRSHPALGQSASYHPGDKSLHYRAQWSSDSDDDSQSDSDCVYRVVLLGDHAVGKTSLAGIFAGVTDKDEHSAEDSYERTLIVDGEEATLIVMDTWENEKLEGDDSSVQDHCLKLGSAYVIVYSVTDRSSFDSAAELRITLRRAHQAENLPIILVGNKSDLVRSREVAVEEGRACAVMFDCKFIETSASLQHNVAELFEGVVRQIRLRRDGTEAIRTRSSIYKRKENLTQKARRFLDRLVARNNQRMAVKVRSKSCHDLAVL